jgi:hypothetical protein
MQPEVMLNWLVTQHGLAVPCLPVAVRIGIGHPITKFRRGR